jgi:hypothetical protein
VQHQLDPAVDPRAAPLGVDGGVGFRRKEPLATEVVGANRAIYVFS